MRKKYYYVIILSVLGISAAGIGRLFSASDMARSLQGKILLQVEANGEAWYINPSDKMRYYMGRPDDAFSLMRELGIGIKTEELEKIKPASENIIGVDSDEDGLSDSFEDAIGTDKSAADTDSDGYLDGIEFAAGYNYKGIGKMAYDNEFSNAQKGKIFLAVEKNGEAWYVNPNDGLRYFLGSPKDAFNLMRRLGLGISNDNLEKIAIKSGIEPPSAENDLLAEMKTHQKQVKEFIAIYDNDDFTRYFPTVEDLFTQGAQETAKEKVSDFFVSFVYEGLNSISDIDLQNEYDMSLDDEETALPFIKVDETTIIIGLGVEEAIPYEIKKVDGKWLIDLDFANDYYDEMNKIADKEYDSEGYEADIYIFGKVKDAIEKYKKDKGLYPAHLFDVLPYYPALKDYLDFYFYASWGNYSKAHLGIELFEDENVLKDDADYDSSSLNDDYGFNGEDPVYDVIFE